MFLNILNQMESKNFLELAYAAMKANEVINEREEAVFNTFKMETGLQDYKLKGKEINQLIIEFKGSSKKVKRAIIIELSGVLDADEVVDEHEERWILKLGKEWDFRDTEIRKMLRWVQDFNDLLAEGYEYINK